ncbi:hypothetical protein JQC92_14405 [Shewanella sp. 202IG2-18]|nr:hypothetical protein [Parashewanella hymeniacidonis]
MFPRLLPSSTGSEYGLLPEDREEEITEAQLRGNDSAASAYLQENRDKPEAEASPRAPSLLDFTTTPETSRFHRNVLRGLTPSDISKVDKIISQLNNTLTLTEASSLVDQANQILVVKGKPIGVFSLKTVEGSASAKGSTVRKLSFELKKVKGHCVVHKQGYDFRGLPDHLNLKKITLSFTSNDFHALNKFQEFLRSQPGLSEKDYHRHSCAFGCRLNDLKKPYDSNRLQIYCSNLNKLLKQFNHPAICVLFKVSENSKDSVTYRVEVKNDLDFTGNSELWSLEVSVRPIRHPEVGFVERESRQYQRQQAEEAKAAKVKQCSEKAEACFSDDTQLCRLKKYMSFKDGVYSLYPITSLSQRALVINFQLEDLVVALNKKDIDRASEITGYAFPRRTLLSDSKTYRMAKDSRIFPVKPAEEANTVSQELAKDLGKLCDSIL